MYEDEPALGAVGQLGSEGPAPDGETGSDLAERKEAAGNTVQVERSARHGH